jgi:AcrR family transcriptional regulator
MAVREWRGTPLPRGRHKLERQVVKASQRERLIRAMLESVAERGYQATSVSQVVASARVSASTFYEFFDDKLDCFLALCDEEARGLLDEVISAAGEPTWRAALERGTEAYLRWWQERPAFSRAYLLEMPAAGPRAVAQRDRVSRPYEEIFAGLARRARAEEPDLPPLPALAPALLAIGVTELLAREVRAGGAERLEERAPGLAELMTNVIAAAGGSELADRP